MSLVSPGAMLRDAHRGGYAVCAFNVENLEMAQAVIEGAEGLNAPVIVQTTPSTLKYAPASAFVGMIASLAGLSRAPVALHLDHATNLDLVRLCLQAGYTSIMIDGSLLPYEENLALSKEAVLIAGGVPVEAELGTVGGKEDELSSDSMLADPEQAEEFVRLTGVSSLAVAIGTAHGVYKGAPKLDLSLLGRIRALLEVPLVLHGGSGVPTATIRACIAQGISKVNYATDLRIAYTQAVRDWMAVNAEGFDPKLYGRAAREAVRAAVDRLISVSGSEGKA